jgi:hypothetical protein
VVQQRAQGTQRISAGQYYTTLDPYELRPESTIPHVASHVAHTYEDKPEFTNHSPIDDEKHHAIHPSPPHSPLSTSNSRFDNFPHDVEKHSTSMTNTTHEWDSTLHGVLPRRPDIETLIKNVVASAGDDERIAIAACGPDSLMWEVRRTATNAIKVKGPSIELYCEQFGW